MAGKTITGHIVCVGVPYWCQQFISRLCCSKACHFSRTSPARSCARSSLRTRPSTASSAWLPTLAVMLFPARSTTCLSPRRCTARAISNQTADWSSQHNTGTCVPSLSCLPMLAYHASSFYCCFVYVSLSVCVSL